MINFLKKLWNIVVLIPRCILLFAAGCFFLVGVVLALFEMLLSVFFSFEA